MDAINWTFK